MALRELLAVFDIKVNDAALTSAEQQLDLLPGRLASIASTIDSTQLKFPGIEMPDAGIVAAPEMGAVGDVPGVVIDVAIDDNTADALSRIEAQARTKADQISARMLLTPSTDTAALQTLSSELTATLASADAAKAKIDEFASTQMDGPSEAVNLLAESLERLEAQPIKTPEMLDAIEKEAEQAAAALTKVGRFEVNAQPVANLKTKLDRVTASTRAHRTAMNQQSAAAKQSGASMGAMSKVLGGLVAGFGVGAAISWGKSILDSSDATAKMGIRLGMGVQEMRAWELMAEQAGASNEHLEGSFKGIANQMQTASLAGKGDMFDAFASLGIDLSDAATRGKPLQETLVDVAGAIGQIPDNAKRTALAQRLMGEAGLKMLPAFVGGSEAARENLKRLMELAEYDEEFVAQTQAANDEMVEFKAVLTGVAASIIKTVLPVLRALMPQMAKIIKAMTPGRIAIVAAAVAYVKWGGAIGIAAKALWNNLIPALKTAGRLVFRMVLPLLVLEDVVTMLTGGDSVAGRLLDKLLGAGTAGAVAEGLASSWDLAWAALTGSDDDVSQATARFLAATQGMDRIAEDFEFFIDDVWNNILGDSTLSWGEVGQFFSDMIESMTSWIGGFAQYLTDTIGDAISSAGSSISKFVSGLPVIGSLFDDEGDGSSGSSTEGGGVGGRATPGGGADGPSAARSPPTPMLASTSQSTEVSVSNAPVINQTFHGVGGSAPDIKAAAAIASQAVGRQLERGNRAIAKQAGVSLGR